MHKVAQDLAHIVIKALIAGEKLKKISTKHAPADLILNAVRTLRDTEYKDALTEEQLIVLVWRSESGKTVYVDTQIWRSV